MTSPFDERLDEILYQHFTEIIKQVDHIAGRKSDVQIEEEAKAAIRTLFLDLIAEAKPAVPSIDTSQPFVTSYANGMKVGKRRAIEEFENNLIQAINGGKK
jgi:hypothetical protein